MIRSLQNDVARRERGFSLTELMIVVAVIGILAAISYPAYTDYSRRAKLADAKDAMFRIAQLQERFFTENNEYAKDASELGFAAAKTDSAQGYWTLTTVGDTDTFTITAEVDTSVHKDDKCDGITLNAQGAKGVKGGGADVHLCWKK